MEKIANKAIPDTKPIVLVVDDDTSNLLAIQTVLEDLPITIIEATSGEQALTIATEDELALILLDVQMPNMDGFEVAKLLAKNQKTKKIPIIFVTAISKEIQYVQQGHELGAVDYLFKPLEPVILKNKVSIFVDYYVKNKQMQTLVSELSNTQEQLKNSNRHLAELAHIDAITGLSNRLNFDKFLAKSLEVAKQQHCLLALLYLDLDDFKYVNDTYGHEMGDRLLQAVAERLKMTTRTSDSHYYNYKDSLFSRLGGDEFALILTNIKEPSQAATVAERIITHINKPFVINNITTKIGISIGIACFPDAGNTADELQKSADTAMYKAKQKGKNNFQYYTKQLNEENQRYVSLQKNFKQAIDKNELSIFYQPIISLKTQKISWCEALCHWQHLTFGIIETNDFIQVAKESGLISNVSYWVIEHIFKDIAKYFLTDHAHLKVYINLSSKPLEDDHFLSFIQSILTKYQLNAKQIILGITEQTLIKSTVILKENIKKLHHIGFKIGIGDFDGSYSLLYQLKDLPIYSIKINKKFIKETTEHNNSIIILKSIIELIKALNLIAITDGIETHAQAKLIEKCHCDYGQGLFFSNPKSIDKFLLTLEKPIRN